MGDEPRPESAGRLIKIGFVLLSSSARPIPSTRVSVLNMLPYLRQAGFDPHIVFEPDKSSETPDVDGLDMQLVRERFDIVFFQKVYGESVLKLAGKLKASGIRTVYGVCDLLQPAMVEATDATAVVTDYLKSLYPAELHEKMHVVHDGIERPEICKTDWGSHRGSRTRPLTAVLVTSMALESLPVLHDPPDWLRVRIVGRYAPTSNRLQRVREAYWQWSAMRGGGERVAFARFLLNPRIERIQWDAERVYQELVQADVGIIPIETDASAGALTGWKVKSENRLTLKMSAGLPVIATPIPAYEPAVIHGDNGYLARSASDWLELLSALREPATRARMGTAARRSALGGYSMALQADRLVKLLHSLVLR